MHEPITLPALRLMKERGEPIVMLTCYDSPTATLLEQADIDILLVGDSVGDNVLGLRNTIPVTLDQMIHHAAAVRRGAERSLIVVDMPFLTYQVSADDAVRNAGRIVKETGVEAVKIEGGESMAPTVARLVAAGIPVMGHIGLTPQSVHLLGGYRKQGRDEAAAQKLLADAAALEGAGAFAIVLELLTEDLARRITAAAVVPTIGIGSGPHCDGQVQVFHDVVGLAADRGLRHARRYAEAGALIADAAARYAADVRERRII